VADAEAKSADLDRVTAARMDDDDCRPAHNDDLAVVKYAGPLDHHDLGGGRGRGCGGHCQSGRTKQEFPHGPSPLHGEARAAEYAGATLAIRG
jgi:hypothetical protein